VDDVLVHADLILMYYNFVIHYLQEWACPTL